LLNNYRSRLSYILKPGETAPLPGIERAFEKAVTVREALVRTMKPGFTGAEMIVKVNQVVGAMPGYKTLSLDNPAAGMSGPGDQRRAPQCPNGAVSG
jgi:hypothetical protein